MYINTNMMASNAANTLSSHYGKLNTSVSRLSSGLRINSAADDAAGLAIRELMRADVASFNQGMRNASDAISMLQVADGALGIIDEKLIRMKELAEQAATGTYNSTQRLMIDSEFQAMASEIDRIANATNFNGNKLLDGSLSGAHNGSGLTSTGKMKIHFGSANDSAEDYYYVNIGDCTLAGLGLRDSLFTNGDIKTVVDGRYDISTINNGSSSNINNLPKLDDMLDKKTDNGGEKSFHRHELAVAYIPKGTTNLKIYLDDYGGPDGFQIFTTSGKHLVGTHPLDPAINNTWAAQFQETGATSKPTISDINTWAITPKYGFNDNATYDGSQLNGSGNNVPAYNGTPPYNTFAVNGMNFGFSGEGNNIVDWNNITMDYLTIDEVTEDLIFCITGDGPCGFTATWDFMPAAGAGPGGDPNPPPSIIPGQPDDPSTPSSPLYGDIISIKTQEKAQQALERINDAIVIKDKARAHIGALQNRFENTVSNLNMMAESLQASESQISDVDVGVEMTRLVRVQILTQSSVAMLSQANSWPHMLVKLIEG